MMVGSFFSRVLAKYALVLPLLLFLAMFFLWPLAGVMTRSVSDPTLSDAFPTLVSQAGAWNGVGVPPGPVQNAFVADLRVLVGNDRELGNVIRRLNSEKAGFRTLLTKTGSAIREAGQEPIELEEVDSRWAIPAYWEAISSALPRYTDRHILAGVDLQRNAAGDIVGIPSSQSSNRSIIVTTLWVSALVTLLTVAIGLPYAIIAANATGWGRNVMLIAVLLPLWTSLLVRTSAWYILLQDKGAVNSMLMWLGLVDHPLALLFNRLGVVIAMTHVLLPLMVLPIYSTVIAIPRNLMPAALSLGAKPIAAFVHVLLPLSLRGIAAGSLLVFISALGYYIMPALLGGAKDQMISSIIAFYAMSTANWNMASALGLILLMITTVLYIVYYRVSEEA
jgi:putative spermidine/putrescine transport system permease protein